MDIAGQRKQEQLVSRNDNKSLFYNKVNKADIEKFLVESKRPLLVKVVEFSLSLIMWIYMAVVLYFFISACVGHNDYFIGVLKISYKMSNQDIRSFVIETAILFLIFFSFLLVWKIYNKLRFGSLNRRSKPHKTTDSDMLTLELIDSKIYELLKSQKVIIFEENPVKELTRRK